jgi:predicted anti-sigma-YlaC factor YlaD
MREDLHERARRLAADSWIDPVSEQETVWLRSHLESCESCRRFASGVEEGIVALRSARIQADRRLVEATQRSVRVYAERVRETRSRVRLLAISCVLSVVWGGVTLPWLWRGCAWLGRAARLPDPAWQAAFVLFWLLPSAVAALLLLSAHGSDSQIERLGPFGGQR